MAACAPRAPAESRRSCSGGWTKSRRSVSGGWTIALVALAASATPALAQQGSIQVTGSAQAVTGDPERLAGQSRLEPDFAINWFQPRSTGSMQMELRATRRGNEPHLGRAYFAWRDAKLGRATWTFEGEQQAIAGATEDHRNGTAAFVAKERPTFNGR